jgi:uncharacterized protein
LSISNLLKQIKNDTGMWQSKFHGITHWLRVEENGHLVADVTGADRLVVSYFAYLHDCQRWNENVDPEHGPRAAAYARLHRDLIDLDDDQFELLVRACSGHTHALPDGKAGVNKTLAACWDGDRLDIDRVGIEIDAKYLFSSFAKSLVD